ncbi:MAG: glycosyltransferase [Chitinophagaceae bacterium]|nr:glycosyltransferase [Chitinophagaceae bacterium]
MQFSSHPNIENHVIYTINKDNTGTYQKNNLAGAASESVFYYSAKWNFNYTCKQLAKLLPDKNCLIVANDLLELGMVSHLGLQNKVLYILHGDYDYYYQLATAHQAAIDVFITVSDSIKKKLLSHISDREGDIVYLRFPVPESSCSNTQKENNSIIFIGRCTEAKGYHLLPTIAAELLAQKINLKWHILGEPDAGEKYQWDSSIKVEHHGVLSNNDVMKLLCSKMLFILPSSAEGMPVSLIESMKAGTVPIMNTLCGGGVQELIKDGETGFLSSKNTVSEYVQIIKKLLNDHSLVECISRRCKDLADKLFNPFTNTAAYENLFEEVAARKFSVKPVIAVYGSRLDKNGYQIF